MIRALACAPAIPQVLHTVPGRGLGGQPGGQLRTFARDVEAVDAVEERGHVASRDERRLEGAGVGAHVGRVQRLDHDHGRPVAREVEAGEHLRLRALHIDLQELDGPGEPGVVDEARQRRDAPPHGAHRGQLAGAGGVGGDHRGEAVQPLDLMQRGLAL